MGICASIMNQGITSLPYMGITEGKRDSKASSEDPQPGRSMLLKDSAKAMPLRQPLDGLTHPSTHRPIYLSIHPLFLYPFFCPPTYLTTHHPLIHLSIHHLSVYPYIYQPRHQSAVHPSTSPPIFPPTHYFMRSIRNQRDRVVTGTVSALVALKVQQGTWVSIKLFIISALTQTPLISEQEQVFQQKSHQERRLICVKSQSRPLCEYPRLGGTRRYSDTGIPSVSPSNATSTPQQGYSGPKDLVNFKIQERQPMEYKAPARKINDDLSWIPGIYMAEGENQVPKVVL